MMKFKKILFVLLLIFIPSIAFSPPRLANVRNFGARPNDSVNDTANIQKASDSLSAGGILFFPLGEWIVDHISIGNDIEVLGESKDTTILRCDRQYGYNYYGIITNQDKGTGNKNITIRNLTIKRTWEYGPGAFDEHIYLENTKDILIENCTFLGTITYPSEAGHSGKGVSLEACQRALVRGCKFYNIPDNALAAHSLANVYYGGHKFEGNTFIRDPEYGGASLIIIAIDGVSLINNDFYAPGGCAATETGKKVNGENSVGIVISGNKSFGASIGLSELTNITVSGNVLINAGIYWRGGREYNTGNLVSVIGNSIKNGEIGGCGFDNIVISGNTILNSPGSGISVLSGKICTIQGNLIDTCHRNGMEIVQVNHLTMSGNTIRNPSGAGSWSYYGMWLESTNDAIIESNKIFDDRNPPLERSFFFMAYGQRMIFRDNVGIGCASSPVFDLTTNEPIPTYIQRGNNIWNGILE